MHTQIIQQYLKALENADLASINQLFDEKATVNSPLYGIRLASVFYKELFDDSNESKIKLDRIFYNEIENSSAALFKYYWTLKNGEEVSFDCVDIFNFNTLSKITSLIIIYDTAQTRSAFEAIKLSK